MVTDQIYVYITFKLKIMKNLFMITVASFFILSCTNNDAIEQENSDWICK